MASGCCCWADGGAADGSEIEPFTGGGPGTKSRFRILVGGLPLAPIGGSVLWGVPAGIT